MFPCNHVNSSLLMTFLSGCDSRCSAMRAAAAMRPGSSSYSWFTTMSGSHPSFVSTVIFFIYPTWLTDSHSNVVQRDRPTYARRLSIPDTEDMHTLSNVSHCALCMVMAQDSLRGIWVNVHTVTCSCPWYSVSSNVEGPSSNSWSSLSDLNTTDFWCMLSTYQRSPFTSQHARLRVTMTRAHSFSSSISGVSTFLTLNFPATLAT